MMLPLNSADTHLLVARELYRDRRAETPDDDRRLARQATIEEMRPDPIWYALVTLRHRVAQAFGSARRRPSVS